MRYRTYAEAKQEVAGIAFSDHPRSRYKSASEFASKARYFSPQRFEKEIKRLEENYVRRRRYFDARRAGANYKEARKASSSPERFREIVNRLRRRREPEERISTPTPRENREEQWSRWASTPNPASKSGYGIFPKYIEERVARVNESMGYEPDGKWGWAVIYYEHVYGLNREWVMENLQVFDRFGDFYRNMVQQTLA